MQSARLGATVRGRGVTAEGLAVAVPCVCGGPTAWGLRGDVLGIPSGPLGNDIQSDIEHPAADSLGPLAFGDEHGQVEQGAIGKKVPIVVPNEFVPVLAQVTIDRALINAQDLSRLPLCELGVSCGRRVRQAEVVVQFGQGADVVQHMSAGGDGCGYAFVHGVLGVQGCETIQWYVWRDVVKRSNPSFTIMTHFL